MRALPTLSAPAQHLLAIALIAAVGLYMFRWVFLPEMTFFMDDWVWLQTAVFFRPNDYATIWLVLPATLFHDRPIEYLTIKVMYELFGLTHRGYAVVILAIHIGNALLLYWLALKLVGSRFYAMVAALCFSINYLVGTPGWWVSVVSDSESLFFCLCAFHAFLSPRRAWSAAGTVVFYWLAVKSKEVAMPFPLLLLAYDFLGRVRGATPRELGTALLATLRFAWPVVCAFIMFFSFAIYYYIEAKSGDMSGYGPYAPKIDVATLIEGVRIYVSFVSMQLVNPNAALAAFALLALVAVATFDRVAIIGVLGFFIGTGPVLFLPAQRLEYYAYAACAYVALAVVSLMRRADGWITARGGEFLLIAGKAVVVVGLGWLAQYVYAKAYYREWVLDRMRETIRAVETLKAAVSHVDENYNIVVTGAQSGPNLFSATPCYAVSVLYKAWGMDCRIEGTDQELLEQYAKFDPPKILLHYEKGVVTRVSSSP